MDLAERFWSKVDRTGDANGCWPWLACTKDRNGKPCGFVLLKGLWLPAHLVAFALAYPTVQRRKGQAVRHTCGVSLCCNPRHLGVAEGSETRVPVVPPILPEAERPEISAIRTDVYGLISGSCSGCRFGGTGTQKTTGDAWWVGGDGGSVRKAPPGQLPAEDRAKLRRMVEDGATAEEIAEQCGTTRANATRALASKAKVAKRQREAQK